MNNYKENTLRFICLDNNKIENYNADDFIGGIMRGRSGKIWKCLETNLEKVENFFDEVEDIVYDYDSDCDDLNMPTDKVINGMLDRVPFMWYESSAYLITEIIDKLKNDLAFYEKYL